MPPVFCVQKGATRQRFICVSTCSFLPQFFATNLRQLRDVAATSLWYSSFKISTIFEGEG
jgi:hypothetical protein